MIFLLICCLQNFVIFSSEMTNLSLSVIYEDRYEIHPFSAICHCYQFQILIKFKYENSKKYVIIVVFWNSKKIQLERIDRGQRQLIDQVKQQGQSKNHVISNSSLSCQNSNYDFILTFNLPSKHKQNNEFVLQRYYINKVLFINRFFRHSKGLFYVPIQLMEFSLRCVLP